MTDNKAKKREVDPSGPYGKNKGKKKRVERWSGGI